MQNVKQNRAMYKGLPTFRAGGVTSCIDTLRAEDGSGHKSALTPTYFSHNHFSSSLADAEDPMMKRTRVTVKVLEGKNFLVSDRLTGTSDPFAVLWIGSSDEGDVDLKYDKRVQSTEVRKGTVDPVWDAEFVFPLEIQSVEDVLSGRVNLLVRDYDDADGDVHYVDLGRVEISLETVLTEGNIMAHTQLVQLPARWYPLQRCRGLKKSQGALKLAVGFFVGPDSVLLRDEYAAAGEQGTESAVSFEHRIKRLRGNDGLKGRRTVSMSPPRGGSVTSRELTKRGGTTFIRPKSAPEATVLTSPAHLRQRPFELKPVQPLFSTAEIQAAATAQSGVNRPNDPQTSSVRSAEASLAGEDRPRWRDTYGSPERRNPDVVGVSHLSEFEKAEPNQARAEPQAEELPTVWPAISPPATARVRPSPKLSRLAARATRDNSGRERSTGASVGWDEQEGAAMLAHRWQRKLLECMQKLESRSTEVAAYGELRALVRGASATQVGQVITAARGVGGTCSLSARRYTLRLLAWLCWDQQRAASKCHGGIISYVLDRIRDDETASLRGELAACVGSVMLSALRHGTATACMVHARQLFRLVGEQRKSVRESAGACCVASILPPSPCIPVELETGLRSIEDVRLTIARAAERGGTTNAVPKEAVLLPGGRAVIELGDAAAAAQFFDRMSATAGDLPSNWRIDPFPEGFCERVDLAHTAHHAKLTVNSEEILAALLEALANGRSEATRGQLFDAVAALAHSCAAYGECDPETSDATEETTASATGRELCGIPATLRKGLPAIVRAVAEVLHCPVRRSYTWKERKAALEVISSLALLAGLRGSEGPLGEHRAKLIEGAIRGKHDSVAAVREAAGRSLLALEATEAGKGKRHITRPFSAPAGTGRPKRGGKGEGTPPTESRPARSEEGRGEERGEERHPRNAARSKVLDGVVRKAARAGRVAADASQGKSEGDRGPPKADYDRRQRQEESDTRGSEDQACPVSPALSEGDHLESAEDLKLQDPQPPPGGTQEWSLPPVGYVGEEERAPDPWKSLPRVAPNPPERNDPSDKDDVGSDKPEQDGRQSSKENTSIPRVQVGIQVGPLDQKSLAEPLSTAAQVVYRSTQVSVPREKTSPQAAEAAMGAGAASQQLAPMHGESQKDTIRLLKHLNRKTNKIAHVLGDLDRRLLCMERTFVERPLATGSPIRSPPPRRLKRPRSTQTAGAKRAGAGKAQAPRGGEEPINTTSPMRAAAIDAEPAGGVSATSCRSIRGGAATRLKRDIGLLAECGDVEGAFRVALSSGTERDVLRLMGRAGGPDLCRPRLGMATRARLFAFVARTISAGRYAEHALPWVFELVRSGEARSLPLAVRMQLAGALHGLAASPTDQGVMAARLGPYLSLTSVGRSSLSDATEGGGVFHSLGVY